MKSKIYAIPQPIMLGSGEALFDHIADCLAKFMKDEKLMNEVLPLGFTFSFPLQQLGLTKGLLERWTKGFNCSGVVGNDVVQLLEEAIQRRGVSIQFLSVHYRNIQLMYDNRYHLARSVQHISCHQDIAVE